MKQALYYSIASAVCAGLLAGGAMKLGPDAMSEYGGPQILVPGGGERTTSQSYSDWGALFTTQNGEVPEYVVGTDSTQGLYAMAADVYGYDAAYQEAADSYAPTAPAPDPDINDALYVAPVKISSPPKPTPVSYPSVDGDVVGHSGETDHADGPALIHVVATRETDESLPS